MQQGRETYSRKKILLWAATFFTALPFAGFFAAQSKKQDKAHDEVLIMLSEDGSLVKVDKKRLASPGKKISNEELQRWVKIKPQ